MDRGENIKFLVKVIFGHAVRHLVDQDFPALVSFCTGPEAA